MNDSLTRRRTAGILLKVLVLVLGLLGQYLGLRRGNFMSGAHFLYYTNISNILSVLLMAVLLVYAMKNKALPAWLAAKRFAITAGILLTFVAFTLLLLPRTNPAYLASLNNVLVHFAVPLLVCLDYVLFDGYEPRKKGFVLFGLALPFCYFVFVIVLSLNGQRFHGTAAPYFFLDYETNGWLTAGDGKLGVVWWFFIILALQLVLSRVVMGLKKIILRDN